MDRPFFYLGGAYLFTLVLLTLSGTGFCIALMVLAAACFLLFVVFNREHRNTLFLAVFVLCLLACSRWLVGIYTEYRPAMAMSGREMHVEGYVEQLCPDSESGAHRCVIRVVNRDGERPRKLRVRFSSRRIRPEEGDYLSFTGRLYPLGSGDPGRMRYFQSQRMYLGAYSYDNVKVTPLERSPLSGARKALLRGTRMFSKLRQKIASPVQSMLGDPYSGLLVGMLLGDRGGMDETLRGQLRTAGILHLFAVSGFHCALWTMALWRLLARAGVGRRPSCIACMLFLLFFSGLTGFSRSCIRAAVMLSLLFLGRMLMRHPDAKNSLGLAVFLLALPNPFAGADPGLLLSASATLGILELAGPLQSLRNPLLSRLPYPIRRGMERVLPPLELSVAAGIFTLPVLVLTFGGISLAAPLTNLLVSSAASLSILLTGIGSLCHSLPVLRLLSRWCFFLSGLSIRYLLAVCRFFSRRRFSYVDLSGRWFLFALALLLLLLAGAILLSYGAESDRELRLSAGLLSGILLLTSVFSWQLLHRNEVSVDFPAVGNGTCAVVCYDGSAAVIGCGGDYRTAGAVSDILERQHAACVTAVLVPRAASTESAALQDLTDAVHPDQIFGPKRLCGAEVTLFPGVSVSCRRLSALLTVQGMRIQICFRPGPADPAADLVYVRGATVPRRGQLTVVSAEEERILPDGVIPTAPCGISVLCRKGRFRIRRNGLQNGAELLKWTRVTE